MARPETKDGSALFDGIGIAEPIAHHGGSDGPSRGLEETKDEVNSDNEEVSESGTDVDKVEPNGNVQEEQTCSASKETNGENSSGVEGIAKLSVDDVSSSVCAHEDGVHGGHDKGIKSTNSRVLQLGLDGRIRLSRKVGHHVASKGNEKGPSIEAGRNESSNQASKQNCQNERTAEPVNRNIACNWNDTMTKPKIYPSHQDSQTS